MDVFSKTPEKLRKISIAKFHGHDLIKPQAGRSQLDEDKGKIQDQNADQEMPGFYGCPVQVLLHLQDACLVRLENGLIFVNEGTCPGSGEGTFFHRPQDDKFHTIFF